MTLRHGFALTVVLAFLSLVAFEANAQQAAAPAAAAPAPKQIAVRAGRLIDGKSDKPIENALILIEGDKIVSVTSGGAAPAGVEVIDLSKATVLPDLWMRTHTFCCKATSLRKITTSSF